MHGFCEDKAVFIKYLAKWNINGLKIVVKSFILNSCTCGLLAELGYYYDNPDSYSQILKNEYWH